jgi:hypothetical protein
MSRPKVYNPQDGYRFQIFCRRYTTEWEHCDYAVDCSDRKHLLTEYSMAYGAGWEFKTVQLPRRCWPKREAGKTEGWNKLVELTPEARELLATK